MAAPVAEAVVNLTDGATKDATAPAKAADYDAVMAPNANWPYSGYDDPWHKAHDAFRADMADLAAAFHACVAQLEAGKPLPAWVSSNFQTFWKLWEELVHHHHDIEENLAFPALTAAKIDVPPKMAAAHPELIQALDSITKSVNSLTPSTDLATYKALADAFDKLRADMLEHFTEEEVIGLYLFRKGMNKAQFQPTEAKIVKTVTPLHMGNLVRPMGDDSARKHFMTHALGIPGPVQALILLPAARSDYARLILEIKAMEPLPREPGCFGALWASLLGRKTV